MSEPVSVSSALLTASASLAVALIGGWFAYRAQVKAIKNQAELQRYQKDLKRLQAEIDDKKSERDARRDYEYEALKRLYQECAPLLFVLSEQAGLAHDRIQGLAQSASQGKFAGGPESWMTKERYRYYRLSTEYRLIAPLATLKILQHRLTQFDLSLDPEIHLIYLLIRQVGRVIADDFELAKLGKTALKYDPHHPEAAELMKEMPAVYWQQGIPRGILDNAAQALVVQKDDAPSRVMTFLEFEAARKDEAGNIHGAFKRIEYLFSDFHPRERPVLWRVLLASANIYRAIGFVINRAHHANQNITAEQLLLSPNFNSSVLDWRDDVSSDVDKMAIDGAESAVRAYLIRELESSTQRCLNAMTKSVATSVKSI